MTKQDKTDMELVLRIGTLFPDERRHLLKLLEGGTILDCQRSAKTDLEQAVADYQACEPWPDPPKP